MRGSLFKIELAPIGVTRVRSTFQSLGYYVGIQCMASDNWSKKEKTTARAAFNKAYEQECAAVIGKVREKSGKLSRPEDLWDLHDYLSKTRDKIDRKYDYRYSVLIMVFAKLIKQKWLRLDDLEGLSPEKLDRIQNYMDLV